MQDRATSAIISPRRLAADVAAALLFSTRLPVPGASAITGADIARAGWALPVAGAIVGLISALVYWLARVSGLPPLAAAGLTIAASLAATGCLHEDGLADFADSFGASTRERKLEIMRDSRVGTYGVCALLLSLLFRALPIRCSLYPLSLQRIWAPVPTWRCSCAWLRQRDRMAFPSEPAGLQAPVQLPRSSSASQRSVSDLGRQPALARSRSWQP